MKHFKANINDVIYMIDRSFCHYTKDHELWRKGMLMPWQGRRAFQYDEDLIGKKAIVKQVPYKEVTKNGSIWLIDVYVPDTDEYLTMTAGYENAHKHNKYEAMEIIEDAEMCASFGY